MSGKHRMTAGRFEDVRERAAKVQCDGVFASPDAGHATDLARLKKAAVERVRRRFGNKHARVAKVFLDCKPWEDAGLPERTFYHALKKVKIFFGARKHWVKSHSRRTVKRKKWQ